MLGRFSNRLLGVVVIVGLAAATQPAPAASNAELQRRNALVIGNADYADQPLQNAVNDARAMSATLNGLGFEVILVENATRKALQKAILKFGERLADGGAGVFYYAGHGLQVRGTNYLVPIDEKFTTESSVRFEATSLDAVLEEMSQPRPGRVNIVILDACRNNPYATRFGGTAAGLAMVDAPTDFIIAYATAPGSVAADGEAGQGLYTSELLKAMVIPNLQIEDMFKRVRAAVSERTRHAQVPWEASSLITEFRFSPPVAAEKPTTMVQQPQTSREERGIRSERQNQDAELAFWESIKDSDNASDYDAYLQAFPNGVFTPLAKARSERLHKNPPTSTASSGPRVQEIEAYYVALVNANIREAPSANSPRVGAVSAGDRLTATGKVEGSDWYRVRLQDGTTGYIFGDLLGPNKPAEATPSSPSSAADTARPTTPAPAPVEADRSPAKASSHPPNTQVSSQPPPAQKNASEPSGGLSPASPRSEAAPESEKTASLLRVPPKVDAPASATGTGAPFRDCPACPKMVRLPSGSFTMGEREGDSSTQPQHRVTIAYSFAMGVTEVTYREWMACVAAGGCSYRPSLPNVSDETPARNLSWSDTQEYVDWLRRTTNKPYRLPTEAEWEYAARGNTTSRYWWGEVPGQGHFNCSNCGSTWNAAAPADVGSLAANPFGLYDMNGSVWEWVVDCWTESYAGTPTDGSAREQANCRQRVLRGGSWLNDANTARSGYRFYYDYYIRYIGNGFRVALTLE